MGDDDSLLAGSGGAVPRSGVFQYDGNMGNAGYATFRSNGVITRHL